MENVWEICCGRHQKCTLSPEPPLMLHSGNGLECLSIPPHDAPVGAES